MSLDFSSIARTARRHAPLVIPYLAVLVMVRAWFHPGLIAGEDFAPQGGYDSALLHHYFPWPDMWDPSSGLGFSADWQLSNLPLLWLAGLIVNAGLGWTVAERVLWLFPLVVLLPLSPYVMAMRLTKSPWASSAAAFAFAVNTWTVGLIERGHIPSLVAYSFIPLVLVFGVAAVRSTSTRAATTLAALILIQASYDFRYAYLATIALAVVLIVEAVARPRQTISQPVFRTMGTVLAAVAIGSLYWIVPSLLSATSLPPGFSAPNAYVTESAKLDVLHSFSLYFPFYHHTVSNDAFRPHAVEWPFVLLGLLVAAGLFVGIRRPFVRAIALIWAFGIVFSSGSTSVFGGFNQWTFVHVPGMTGFRDGTKLFAFVNTGAAVGIAVLLSSLPAIRLGALYVSRRTVLIACSLVFVVFYAFAVRAAYDPLRLSNFATAQLGRSDALLHRYLSSAPPGRVLFFPVIPVDYDFDQSHPAISAAMLGSSDWPFGLAALQPPGSKNASGVYDFFAFYGSPLLRPLLCETGVRYVALVTDPTSAVFVPWQYGIERAESMQFLAARPWLRPVDFGSDAGPDDLRTRLYKVTGCQSDPSRLAFVARYPVVFQGGGAFLESLAGSVFWRRDPAVAIAEQQSGFAPYEAIRNVVSAPTVFDPQNAVEDELGYRAWAKPLAEGARRAGNEPFAYRGFAFNRSAQADVLGLPIPPGLIKQTFTSGGGDATVDAFVTAQAAATQQILRATSLVPMPGLAVSTSRELVNPEAFDVFAGNGFILPLPSDLEKTKPRAKSEDDEQGAQDGQNDRSDQNDEVPAVDKEWLQFASSGGEIAIANPQLAPVTADVTLPGAVALSGAFDTYTLTINGTSSWGLALPHVLQSAFGLSLPATLHNVTLMPGSNSLLLQPSPGSTTDSVLSNIAVNPQVVVSNVRPQGTAETSVPLTVSQHSGPGGVQLRVATSQAAESPATARFRMISGLSVPLSVRPLVRVRYLAPDDPLSFDVALGLDGPYGKTEYLVNLPRGAHASTIDVYGFVRRSLAAVRRDREKKHASDYEWLRRDAYTPQPEASSFVLRYADLILVKPASVAVLGAAGTYQSVAVVVPRSAVAVPRKRYLAQLDFRESKAPVDVVTQNVNLQATLRSRHALALTASLLRLAQQTMPSRIQLGDSAKLVLTNGTIVQGLIAFDDDKMIVVKTGEEYTGIPRDAIATISNVYASARQVLSFVVPFDVPPDASNLEFAVSQDPGLSLKITLLVRDGETGKVTEVIPQDRALASTQSDQIPSQWSTGEPDLTRSAPLDADGPLAQADLPVVGLGRTFYDLPLQDVFASEDPSAQNPHVVGIRFAFDASNVDTVGAHSVNVEISGVAATSARLATVASAFPGTQPNAVLQIDGKDVVLRPTSAMTEGAQRGAMATGSTRLQAGTHLLWAGQHDPTVVQWGLVALGRPASSRPSDIADLSGASSAFSERYGDLQTGGGILVMPTTFWSPWRVALAPASFAPSGVPALDYLRLLPWMQARETHLRVNGGLNAWVVPPFHGRVVFIYETEFYLAAGVGLEIVLVGVWILLARRRTGDAA